MVIVNTGSTARVTNDNKAKPFFLKLVWIGIRAIVYHPERFRSDAISRDILVNDEASSPQLVTRLVTYRTPEGERNSTEVCKMYPQCHAEIEKEDGMTIGYYVTRGDTEEDLYLTCTIQQPVPGVNSGSKEEQALVDKYRELTKTWLGEDIEHMRELYDFLLQYTR
ncbi:hypothetical protein NEMBOFW57_010863 [Staphylotrichum longicolle]|uniref:Uncharacterized protein n=1 Tax=Staphylotrichum longicolle TaxID=669026 RepID=A0AAD4ENH0_9PEZI|nr:hypothetical protein NEMBOFW57_010863 [Staphylotrichum longicolle]